MPAGLVASELEAKLLVEREGDLDTLARLTRLGHYRLRARPIQDLYSVYLDTKDLALARHGVALRVRRCGETWEATVKWAGSVRGVIHQRPELTSALAGPPAARFTLPPDFRIHLTAMLAGREVAPILVSEIQRTPIDVLDAQAVRRLAEIALDRVYLHGPRKRDPRGERYCEIEVERKDGTVEDVASITALIRRGRRMHAAPDTKFSRGLRLLYASAGPALPLSIDLDFDDSANVAARKIVARHFRRLIEHDPGTRLGHDPEALHDMRVATRRLRAVVRVLAPSFPAGLHKTLTRELRWLGQLLGSVRDIDVQLQRLDARKRDLRGNRCPALRPYAEYLGRLRQHSRALMLAGLDSPRYLHLLRKLEAYATAPIAGDPSESIAAIGVRTIRKAHKQLRKRGDKISKDPSAEDLHEVRIRSKRVRYICEFLSPLTGRPGRRFVKRMVELQTLLGAHNDAVVATEYVRRFLNDESATVSDATRRSVARLIRADEEQALDSRSGFHRAWKRFARRQAADEVEATLDRLIAPRREG